MKLSVATHNICHMGMDPTDRTELVNGAYRNGYDADKVPLMRVSWAAVYAPLGADLIGIQEYYPWFDNAHTIPTDGEIFRPYGLSRYGGEHGVAVAARFELVPVSEGVFEGVSARYHQKFYLDIGGVRLAVFNAHPTPKGTEEGYRLRQAEYQALIREFQREEYFVAFGDYNARTTEEYAPFRAAGYPMANTGIHTVETGSMTDNIITSSNIRIGNIRLCDPAFSLSDHAVLAADIEIPD